MKKGKEVIPVYDICSLANTMHLHDDIIVENFAAYLKRHPDLHFPHRHSFYHFVYFTKGSGSYSIDFERFNVKPGQIYFMVPGQVHAWYFDPGTIDGIIVNFSEEILYPILNDGLEQFPFFNGNAVDSVIQLKNAGAVAALFDGMITEMKDNMIYSKEMIAIGLLSVFIRVSRGVEHKHKKIVRQNQVLLQNFRKLVNEYFSSKKLPKEYAAMLYVTPNHLNALCSDALGQPAGEIIRNRVLLEAKRLLINADITIAEIASHLNFKDNSYFARFFRNIPRSLLKNSEGQ